MCSGNDAEKYNFFVIREKKIIKRSMMYINELQYE